MKKNVKTTLGIALALVAFVSCSRTEFDSAADMVAADDEVTFTGTFEQPAGDNGAKTVLGGTDNHQVLWVKSDAIKIWDEAGKSAGFTAVSGGTTSRFTKSSAEEGFSPEDARYAFYPESAVESYDNGVVTFTIPATQTYAENSFGQDANFAVSIIKDHTEEGKLNKLLPFTNVAGVLRIQLSCNSETQLVKVSRIVFKDNTNNICGTFTVDAKETTPDAVYAGDGGKKITLECPTPVALSTDQANPTSFYITLPVGAITQNSGFVAEVYNDYDHLVTVLKASNKNGNATITRSNITKMSNKHVTWLPKNVTEGFYLQSNTTQYINTGVNPSACGGIRIQMKARLDGYGVEWTNPSICGVVNTSDETTWSPWISIDYHKNHNSIRACFSNDNLYPDEAIEAGKVFECDVTFVPNKFTATFNGGSSHYDVHEPTNKLPNNNLYLFGSCVINNSSSDNRSASSIFSFVVYDANGNMIRNFIPIQSNGANGMIDMVYGTIYSKQAGDPFTIGLRQ